MLPQCQVISTPPPFSKEHPMLSGFGYVSSEDDFKFVLGVVDDYEYNINGTIFVISLRNNTCRMVEENDKVNALARW